MTKFLFLLLAIAAPLHADPILNSWFTDNSGQYARLYETLAAETTGPSAAVTTWYRGQGVQALPTYSGIHQISYTATDVYLRTTGLGSHIMGPWYLNAAKTNLFPNYPDNQAFIYRIPRDPGTPPTNKTLTGLGRIGLFVDGVTMFDSRDAFSYDNSAATDDSPNGGAAINGDGIWNRDAYINESVTFDAANAHQAGSNYHYHANPPALRNHLGDSVDHNPNTNIYTENFNSEHSPIIGWVRDGYPVYGPYGYADPSDANSTVRRMTSGFQIRNITVRQVLPAHAARDQGFTAAGSTALHTLNATQYGPAVNAQYTIGHYIEDYEYLGDLGQTQGVQFDLDEHNGRFCVTPEFPGGTYAYFTAIEADGTPKYPYNIGRTYYGNPTANNADTIPATATTLFEGGPEADEQMELLTTNQSNGDVTITWSAVQGGTYKVEASTNLANWTDLPGNTTATNNTASRTDTATLNTNDRRFYRAGRTALATFDDTGFDYTEQPTAQNNILLLIVDDWGTDSSPLDNPGGASHASMPTLAGLAANGLRFTNAYAQPVCSPTRASLITGRYAFRHGIGNPMGATLPANEFTLPEAFATAASPYALASYGKWHLGGGANGPLTLGGWTEYAGILTGGVDDYFLWDKTKNGTTTADVTTYTTTDQVNESIDFITTQGNNPWFTWVAFNAPHTPFHEPPTDLLPSNPTGTSNRALYEKALEAMDTEIARLLQSVDLSRTNVILIGDNGTPGQAVQAPYSNGHAKDSLYEGGVHVPLIATGPDVSAIGTTDELVHCVDLYATILSLAGIALPTDIDGRNLVPVFQGTDITDGCIVVEKFGNGGDGRAIRDGDYKLIIYDDPAITTDTATYEFYNVVSDENEQTNLLLGTLTSAEQSAYDAIIAKNTALGGNFGNSGGGNEQTVYIELDTNATPNIPPLINTMPAAVHPEAVTIGGQPATFEVTTLPDGNPTSRVDANGTSSRFWVKVAFDPVAAGLTPGSYDKIVEFRPTPMGNLPRVYTGLNQFVVN
jgi:arylsulfatase A-like enzyme